VARALSSTSSIMRVTTTTDTGDPIAVPTTSNKQSHLLLNEMQVVEILIKNSFIADSVVVIIGLDLVTTLAGTNQS